MICDTLKERTLIFLWKIRKLSSSQNPNIYIVEGVPKDPGFRKEIVLIVSIFLVEWHSVQLVNLDYHSVDRRELTKH